jgi:hypothetical protein
VPGFTVTRSDGIDWADDGFIVGHLVHVETGAIAGHWRLVDIFDGGQSMTLKTLEHAPLAEAQGVQSVLSVAGQHGGLTVVHGGGNALLQISGAMNAANDVGCPAAAPAAASRGSTACPGSLTISRSANGCRSAARLEPA